MILVESWSSSELGWTMRMTSHYSTDYDPVPVPLGYWFKCVFGGSRAW